MLGHIMLIEERGRGPIQTHEDVLGLGFCKVAVPVGGDLGRWRLERRLKKAARMLELAGVRRVLAAPGFPGWSQLSVRGMLAVDTAAFLQAMAAPLALAALERRAVPPENAVICLRGNRVTRPFFQCAEALCPRVRGLTVSAPAGGGALADYLRREYGVAVLEEGAADLTVCFSDADVAGALALGGPQRDLLGLTFGLKDMELPGSFEPLPLLAALWEEGRLPSDLLEIHPEIHSEKET